MVFPLLSQISCVVKLWLFESFTCICQSIYNFPSAVCRHWPCAKQAALADRAPCQNGQMPGGLLWSDASIGGPGSVERCAGIRQKTASPCDAAAVIECEQKKHDFGSFILIRVHYSSYLYDSHMVKWLRF